MSQGVATTISGRLQRLPNQVKALAIVFGIGAGIYILSKTENWVKSFFGQQSQTGSQDQGYDTSSWGGLAGGGLSDGGTGYTGGSGYTGGGGQGSIPTGAGYGDYGIYGAGGGGVPAPFNTTPPIDGSPRPPSVPSNTKTTTIPGGGTQTATALMYEAPNFNPGPYSSSPVELAGYFTGYAIGSLMRAVRTFQMPNFNPFPTVGASPITYTSKNAPSSSLLGFPSKPLAPAPTVIFQPPVKRAPISSHVM